MKILTIYYSYTGTCRKAAEDIAKKRNTAIYEVKDKKRPSLAAAYTIGSLKAILGKTASIEPITADLNTYDRIIIVSPIWASRAAPVTNTLIEHLPPDKKIEVIMISTSGKSKCKDRITAKIKSKKSSLVRFTDMKANPPAPAHNKKS